MLPDLELARRFVARQPLPGELLLCAITGSHHYGFPSPDSDIDIKGIHLAPTANVLGLKPVQETFDRLEVFEDVECDLTTHEAAKALNLLLQGNGNLLERLCSPFQLVEGELTEQLQALVPAALSRRCYKHYSGYCRGMQAEHLRDGYRVKSMLYTYRVALTGRHVLLTGEVVADLGVLAELYEFPELHDLIEKKTGGREKATLTEEESLRYRERWREIPEALKAARDASHLPEEPPDPEACERWLVETRMERGT